MSRKITHLYKNIKKLDWKVLYQKTNSEKKVIVNNK